MGNNSAIKKRANNSIVKVINNLVENKMEQCQQRAITLYHKKRGQLL